MKNKTVTLIFTLIAFAAVIGIAQAQIHGAIEVKDSIGNKIDGQTVPIGTTVYVYGTYTDDQGAPAAALMEVYYNGTGPNTHETLYSGIVPSGSTTTKTYQLTKLGTYEFKWTVTKQLASASTQGIAGAYCIQQRALARTTVDAFHVPEPATIAGLIMGLSALGLVAIKKRR
jgi:hypothetical protein